MGVAIEMGSVRSAQKVKIHDVATITLLDAPSVKTCGVSSEMAGSFPLMAVSRINAVPPKIVEQRSVGKTAFSRTLAFFARS